MRYSAEQRRLLDSAFRADPYSERFPAFLTRRPTQSNTWASGALALVGIVTFAAAVLSVVGYMAVVSDGKDSVRLDLHMVASVLLAGAAACLYGFASVALRSENTTVRRAALVGAAVVTVLGVVALNVAMLVVGVLLAWAAPYTWWDRAEVAARIREQHPVSAVERAAWERQNKQAAAAAFSAVIIIGMFVYNAWENTRNNGTGTGTLPAVVWTDPVTRANYVADVRENAAIWAMHYTDMDIVTVGEHYCRQVIDRSEMVSPHPLVTEPISATEVSEVQRVIENAASEHLCPA